MVWFSGLAELLLTLQQGQRIDRQALLKKLEDNQ